MYTVILSELGILVFENKKCLKVFSFSEPSKEFVAIKKRESKISKTINYLEKLEGPIEISDESLRQILKKNSVESQIMDDQQIADIQASKPQLIVEAGLAKNESEAMAKLRDFAIQLSSSKVSEISQSPDMHIIQGISTLDETDKIINSLSSRIREWYGLHFPELENVIDSIKGYSQIVTVGRRENLSKKVYEDAGFPESKVEMLTLVAEKSRGGEISDENLAIVKSLAKQILELYELRNNLEAHLEKQMDEHAPNTSAILGNTVGARILARAGSLKNLSSMPASTIQVLGAEKALFRSLKTGSQPPKHGLLFQHSMVHAAPRWQRGKIARAIAAKAAIAARVDQYGEGVNQTLLEKLNIRVDEIGTKYKSPPPRKEPKMKEFPERKFQSYKSKKKKRKKFGKRR